ncbi:putative reverse transcriptase domain-containing protein [Tanacetum coccineum]
MLRGLDQLMEKKEDGVDRLTKSAYFLVIREDYKTEKLARLYIDEIVAGHGVPVSIISDRDGRFTSTFLANITESPRDTIRYEYGLSSLDGWTKLIGLELVQETTDKVVLIKEKLKAVRNRQKSYGDNRRKPLEIGPVAYRLRLLKEFSSVHDTFHVSNLKKCLADANLHVPLDEIKIDKTLRFIKEPIEIMDRQVKSLKRSKIPIVKVRWDSKHGPKFT